MGLMLVLCKNTRTESRTYDGGDRTSGRGTKVVGVRRIWKTELDFTVKERLEKGWISNTSSGRHDEKKYVELEKEDPKSY